MRSRRRRRARQAALLAFALPFSVTACSASPSLNVLGSFFPSWILCAVIGGAAAIAIRLLLHEAGIGWFVTAPPLFYLAFAVSITLLVWLLCFGQ